MGVDRGWNGFGTDGVDEVAHLELGGAEHRGVGLGGQQGRERGERGHQAVGETADETIRARWRVEHVGPLVELLTLDDTPEWNDLWTAA